MFTFRKIKNRILTGKTRIPAHVSHHLVLVALHNNHSLRQLLTDFYDMQEAGELSARLYRELVRFIDMVKYEIEEESRQKHEEWKAQATLIVKASGKIVWNTSKTLVRITFLGLVLIFKEATEIKSIFDLGSRTSAHYRRSYYRKDGTYVSGTSVSASHRVTRYVV